MFYFDDIFEIEYFNLDNVLLDEKSYKNILPYNISYKTLIHIKLLRIMFDKINVFIRLYDGTRHLVLFGIEKYDFVNNRIRYPIGVNGGTTYTISHNHGKIKVDS